MKNKRDSIIILPVKRILGLSVVLITLFFVLIGCSKSKSHFNSEKDVLKYLRKEYKNETFEIIKHESIDLVDEKNCKDKVEKGNSYTVRSNETKLAFTVKDVYYYNMLYCDVIKYDDYLNVSLEEYSKELDPRTEITYAKGVYETPTILINLSDYENINEMSKVIYDFSKYINNKYPYYEGKSINFRVCTGSLLSSNCKNIASNTIDSESAIVSKINENG